MSVWLRRLLTFVCLMAAWLVVRPAAAAAPLCDLRGASVLAPMPTLDLPNSSLDVGDVAEGCEGWVNRDHVLQRGERPTQVSPSAPGDAVLTAVVSQVPPAAPGGALLVDTGSAPRPGVRSPLERPPRPRPLSSR